VLQGWEFTEDIPSDIHIVDNSAPPKQKPAPTHIQVRRALSRSLGFVSQCLDSDCSFGVQALNKEAVEKTMLRHTRVSHSPSKSRKKRK